MRRLKLLLILGIVGTSHAYGQQASGQSEDEIAIREMVADQKSQRVAWGVVDQESPIMETGLSNLTQDASPALIHFADGQTQQ